MDLKTCIIKGLKEPAYKVTKKMLEEKEPLEIINTELVPALDIVGKGFEKGTMFLPQLLMSAEAAKAGFAAVKEDVYKRQISLLPTKSVKESSSAHAIFSSVYNDAFFTPRSS